MGFSHLAGLSFLLAALSVSANPIDYQVNGDPYEGYFVSPETASPLVVLIHDWDGLNAYEIKRADMLAEQGYAVFAADLFGKGIRPTEVKDKRQHTSELYADRHKMRELIHGAIDQAAMLGADTNRTVVIGYCFGGAAALEMARSGADLSGFVSFHGGLSTPEGQDYSATQSTVLVLHGTADKMISMQDFATLAVELEHHQVPHELISYGGADHSFTVFNGQAYDAEADQKSWLRLLDFLENQLN